MKLKYACFIYCNTLYMFYIVYFYFSYVYQTASTESSEIFTNANKHYRP